MVAAVYQLIFSMTLGLIKYEHSNAGVFVYNFFSLNTI